MSEMHGAPIRVAASMSGGTEKGMAKWFYADGHRYVRHDLRSVLPNQIVFDIGDDGDWGKARAETHALWSALHRLGIKSFWGAPSGGKGIHTEVFGPVVYDMDPDWDWRPEVANTILDLAQQILAKATNNPFAVIDADPCTINPREGSRQIREFGYGKKPGFKKALWTSGGAIINPLPKTREETYDALGQRGSPIPTTVPIANNLPETVYRFRFVKEALGFGGCPQSPKCVFGEEGQWWPDFCNGCPAMA